MKFDIAYAISIVPDILWASLTTAYISVVSGAFAIVGGFLLALGRRGPTMISLPCGAIVNCIRLSPFLVQLYFFYYVLPFYGLTLPAVWVGIIALSLNSGCFLAEVFGAGLDAIARGQIDAAKSLGLRRMQIVLLILIPQMLRIVLAPTAGYMITLFKTTPYLAIIGVPEMLGTAFDHASNTFRYVEPLSVVGALFFIYCAVISYSVRRLEARLGRSARR